MIDLTKINVVSNDIEKKLTYIGKNGEREYLFADDKIKVPTFFGHFTGKVIDITISNETGELVITVVILGFITIKFKPKDLINIVKVK